MSRQPLGERCKRISGKSQTRLANRAQIPGLEVLCLTWFCPAIRLLLAAATTLLCRSRRSKLFLGIFIRSPVGDLNSIDCGAVDRLHINSAALCLVQRRRFSNVTPARFYPR